MNWTVGAGGSAGAELQSKTQLCGSLATEEEREEKLSLWRDQGTVLKLNLGSHSVGCS